MTSMKAKPDIDKVTPENTAQYVLDLYKAFGIMWGDHTKMQRQIAELQTEVDRQRDIVRNMGDAAKFMEIAAKLPSGEQVERNLELRRTIRCLMDSLTVALGKLS